MSVFFEKNPKERRTDDKFANTEAIRLRQSFIGVQIYMMAFINAVPSTWPRFQVALYRVRNVRVYGRVDLSTIREIAFVALANLCCDKE